MNVAPYAALALQARCDAVNPDPDRKAAEARMDRSLDRIATQVAAASGWIKSFHDVPLKLVVLPEYALTGFPMQEDIAGWRDKAALEPGSFAHKRLGAIAKAHNLHLAINVYEVNALSPEIYFQAMLLFSPEGEVVLRYLRMVSINSPSPFDFWDRYIDMVGLEGVFPVADTPIGRIGAVASEEILFPEIARATCLRGAELLLHSTSEVSGPGLTPKDIAKRARAIENGVYVVSANSATIAGTAIAPHSTDGLSKVVGPDGAVLAETGPGESINAASIIDIEALRKRRARAAMSNLLPRLPAKAFVPYYDTASTLQPNGLLDKPDFERVWLRERLRPLAEGLASGKVEKL